MKKAFKTIFILGIVASMLFASVSSVFASGRDVDVYDFKGLLNVCSNVKENEEINIYLKSDINIQSTLEINEPCKLHFYGKATLTNTSPDEGFFYLDEDDIKLDFHDVTLDGGSNFSGRYYEDDGQAFYVNGDNCRIEGAKMVSCGSDTIRGWSPDMTDFANAFHSWNGGAIYIAGSETEIINCEFIGCGAQDDGGAICIYYDDQLIQGCTFENCNANDDGGAIYCCTGVDDVIITACTFKNCTCDDNTVGNNVYGRDNTLIAGCSKDQWTDELFYRCTFQEQPYTASMFSNGNIIIIAAVVVVAAAVVFFVLKKKKAAQN